MLPLWKQLPLPGRHGAQRTWGQLSPYPSAGWKEPLGWVNLTFLFEDSLCTWSDIGRVPFQFIEKPALKSVFNNEDVTTQNAITTATALGNIVTWRRTCSWRSPPCRACLTRPKWRHRTPSPPLWGTLWQRTLPTRSGWKSPDSPIFCSATLGEANCVPKCPQEPANPSHQHPWLGEDCWVESLRGHGAGRVRGERRRVHCVGDTPQLKMCELEFTFPGCKEGDGGAKYKTPAIEFQQTVQLLDLHITDAHGVSGAGGGGARWTSPNSKLEEIPRPVLTTRYSPDDFQFFRRSWQRYVILVAKLQLPLITWPGICSFIQQCS